MRYIPKELFHRLWYTTAMRTKYIFGSVSIIALGVGIFFAVQLYRTKTFFASNTPAQTDISRIRESDSSSSMPVDANTALDQSQEVPTESVSPVSVVAETPVVADVPTTQQKSEKTVAAKEVPQKGAQKIPEATSKVAIHNKLVSFGFATPSKPRTIDTIILHSSYDALGDDPYSVSGVIAEWKDAGVAPHYLIARDGTVYRLVKDEDIAYHAGVSQVPDGRTNTNDFSLGIEILNTKTDTYTDAQYASVRQFIAFLKGAYTIKYILGHDAIAPGRKTDPWNFDWKKL